MMVNIVRYICKIILQTKCVLISAPTDTKFYFKAATVSSSNQMSNFKMVSC